MRLDLVIRTSQRKRDAQSPAQQRQQAQGICRLGGHTIAAEHDSGRSESGKTMERAALAAARARIRSGETDGIVVGYLDRLGRAPIEESMGFVRELTRDGGRLVAADWGPDAIDLTEPFAETMLVQRLQWNREQWLQAAARYRLSQRNAVEAGKFAAPTPFGYVRRGGRLFPHEKRGPIVRHAFRLAAGEGLRAAVAYLHTAAPGRRWDTDSARRLLASRAYLGESRVEHADEVLVNENAHEPLTTLGNWHAAQSAARPRRAGGDYPLSHVATCGACGAGLVGAVMRQRDGSPYRRMRCSAACAGGVGSIGADALEGFVRDALRPALESKAFRLGYDGGDVDGATAALELAEARLTRYLEDTETRDEVGEDQWRKGRRAHVARVTGARERLAEVASSSARTMQLPGPGQLDDPAQFRRALAVIGRLVVAPGRGRVEDRVTLEWVDVDDLDGRVGVLAA